MPITSQQMSGMIGGQQAMFGNFASYSQQISPGFQGSPPSYSNPMAGVGAGFPQAPFPMHNPATMAGAQTLSAIGNVGLPALGTAAMLGGSMLPGPVGNFVGGLDPVTMGFRGFARGAGLRAGGQGIMANMGRIATGGVGSIARAGMAGIGGAALGALPMLAVGQAAQYGVGQMVQGAQFQNQVQGMLNQNFRFMNPASRSGYGFSREQGSQIADMVREMGHSDMMTGPQELLRVMQSGTQQGLFRAVQDVKEFKKRFTDMVGSLKEVAKTMNTTLEGAIPFFSQARQMGFWTPQDISRNAQQTRQTAAASGLSVAQTQQMMAQGAQMARSIGATGASGAVGMAQSMGLVGGGLRSGVISERALSEATGGLIGPQAVQSLSGTLQAATTRFARSRRARWMLASLGRDGFTSLDQGKMQDMMYGGMGLGEMGRSARRNIREQGAFNFVNNEKELRGELLRQGPMAQLGFMRSMIGGRIYGDDPKSKLITRRLMKRYFGVGGRQADVLTSLAREAPQIMRANEARSSEAMDQQERDREQIMNRSMEGIKRKVSNWWDKNVKEDLQKFGADMNKSIGDFYEKMGDKLWGRTATRHRLRGITGFGMEGLQKSAMGDTSIMEQTFGKRETFDKFMGGASDLGNLLTGGKGMDEGLAAAASGNVFSNRQAAALGFGGMDEAKSAIAAAREEIGGNTFGGAAALMAARTGKSGRALGEAQVKAIMGGKMGSDSLRTYLGRGKTMREKVNLLAAAQSKEMRGRRGGIDLSEEAKEAGADLFSNLDAMEKFTAAGMEKREEALGAAIEQSVLAGGGFGDVIGDQVMVKTKTSQETIASISDKGGKEFKQAMTLMAQGGEENEKKARDLLRGMMGNPDLTKEEVEVLNAMADPTHKDADNIKRSMQGLGEMIQIKERVAFTESNIRRSNRMFRAMGDRKSEILGTFDKVKSSSGETSLGGLLRGLASAKPDDIKGYTNKIRQLVEFAGDADEEQISRAAAVLSEIGGGEHIVAALRGGRQVSAIASALTGKSGKKEDAANAANYLLSGMMGGRHITPTEMKDIMAGGTQADATVQTVLQDIPKEKRKRVEEMLNEIKNKEPSKLLQIARDQETARAIGQGADPSKNVLMDQASKIRGDIDVIGQVGSPKGMHLELSRQTLILMQMRDSLEGVKGAKDPTFNPKEKATE